MYTHTTTSHRHWGTVWRHIGANNDKTCQKSTFNRGCAANLDVEINRLFLVVFFLIYRKLSNNIVMQCRVMSLSSLWSLGWCQFSFLGMFKLPFLHNIDVGNLAVNINYSFHSFVFVTDTSIGVSHLNTCFLHQSYNLYTMASPEISNISWLSCQNWLSMQECRLAVVFYLQTKSKPRV